MRTAVDGRRSTVDGTRRVAVALLVALSLGACRRDIGNTEKEASALTGGDPERGKALIEAYGCGSCHTIPGVPGAHATVGPSLATVAGQSFIAGVLQNTPENMVKWIQDPQKVDSLTAMPTLGLTEGQARHVAAYLYSLR